MGNASISANLNPLVHTLVAGLVILMVPDIYAVELYRCTQDGQVEFRQTPCPTGEQEKTRVVEQSRGMTPVEPGLRLEPKKAPGKKSRSTRKVAQRTNQERCWKVEKRLERIESRLRAGYKASQYGKLHRTQDEYEDYLKRFCR